MAGPARAGAEERNGHGPGSRGGPGDGQSTSLPRRRPARPEPRGAPTARKGLGGQYGASFTGEGTRGLTFERRWTRPGVHPYDEITWEYRTADIANESGKTVFEQKDVEVPTFWSQLATNVVVSKYFRGHIGTPEREHSVKQLIDRVVNTHRRAGRRPSTTSPPTRTSPRSRPS